MKLVLHRDRIEVRTECVQDVAYLQRLGADTRYQSAQVLKAVVAGELATDAHDTPDSIVITLRWEDARVGRTMEQGNVLLSAAEGKVREFPRPELELSASVR